jgi:hypothetical protein
MIFDSMQTVGKDNSKKCKWLCTFFCISFTLQEAINGVSSKVAGSGFNTLPQVYSLGTD